MTQELSQRQLRVGQEVQKVIATAIEQGDVRSEEISKAFITITKVVMSPDLKYATVYLTTLNGKNLGVVFKLYERPFLSLCLLINPFSTSSFTWS